MNFPIQKLSRVPAFLKGVQTRFNMLCDVVVWLTKMQDNEFVTFRKTTTGWTPELSISAISSAVGASLNSDYVQGDGAGAGGIPTGGGGSGGSSGNGGPNIPGTGIDEDGNLVDEETGLPFQPTEIQVCQVVGGVKTLRKAKVLMTDLYD